MNYYMTGRILVLPLRLIQIPIDFNTMMVEISEFEESFTALLLLVILLSQLNCSFVESKGKLQSVALHVDVSPSFTAVAHPVPGIGNKLAGCLIIVTHSCLHILFCPDTLLIDSA